MTRRTLISLALATLLSAAALAAPTGKGGMPHEDMQAFRDAVMSGALTDAELATLKQEREAMQQKLRSLRADSNLNEAARTQQTKQLHDAMHQKLATLIGNTDKTAPRTAMPENLRDMGERHRDGKEAGQHKGSMLKREDMQAFRTAVMSGALTDAELGQLQQAFKTQMTQARESGQRPDPATWLTQMKQLAANNDKTAARSSWPAELRGPLGKPHRD